MVVTAADVAAADVVVAGAVVDGAVAVAVDVEVDVVVEAEVPTAGPAVVAAGATELDDEGADAVEPPFELPQPVRTPPRTTTASRARARRGRSPAGRRR